MKGLITRRNTIKCISQKGRVWFIPKDNIIKLKNYHIQKCLINYSNIQIKILNGRFNKNFLISEKKKEKEKEVLNKNNGIKKKYCRSCVKDYLRIFIPNNVNFIKKRINKKNLPLIKKNDFKLFDKKYINFQNSLFKQTIHNRSRTLSLNSKCKNDISNKTDNIKNVVNDNSYLNENKKSIKHKFYCTLSHFERKSFINEHFGNSERLMLKSHNKLNYNNENKSLKNLKIDIFTLGKSYTSFPLKNLIIEFK